MAKTPEAVRVGFIHATSVSIEPLHAALAECWPSVNGFDILDTALTLDRDAGLPLEAFRGRFEALLSHAIASSAQAVLFTCSAFGPLIEDLSRTAPIPVLKPNEPMFRAALAIGRRIGLVATHAPAVPGLQAEFARLAPANSTLIVYFVEGALAALREGRPEEHDRLVADAASRIADVDALMLAHFSTSRALAAVKAVSRLPILTAPLAAIDALRGAVGLQTG